MKKALLAAVALSAFCGAAQAEPIFDWSGFYGGVTAGYVFGTNLQGSDPSFVSGSLGPAPTLSSPSASAEIGYNWLHDNLLLGVEADISTNATGSRAQGTVGGVGTIWFCGTGPCELTIAHPATLRARVGVTGDKWLAFATGGIAVASISGGILASGEGDLAPVTKAGWVAGAGVAYALSDMASAKLEYVHTDFGTVQVGSNPYYTQAHSDAIRLGVDFKFGQ